MTHVNLALIYRKFTKCIPFMSKISKTCPLFALLCDCGLEHGNMSFGYKICQVGNLGLNTRSVLGTNFSSSVGMVNRSKAKTDSLSRGKAGIIRVQNYEKMMVIHLLIDILSSILGHK